MKKIILLVLVLVLTNCGATKKPVVTPEEWISAQNFTVVKPENWRAVLHHGYVGYTPVKEGQNHFNCLVSVFLIKNDPIQDLRDFALNHMTETYKVIRISSQKASTKENHLGVSYIHQYNSNFMGQSHKVYIVYFEYNNEYYYYKYSCLERNYENHFKDAMSILNTIEFK